MYWVIEWWRWERMEGWRAPRNRAALLLPGCRCGSIFLFILNAVGMLVVLSVVGCELLTVGVGEKLKNMTPHTHTKHSLVPCVSLQVSPCQSPGGPDVYQWPDGELAGCHEGHGSDPKASGIDGSRTGAAMWGGSTCQRWGQGCLGADVISIYTLSSNRLQWAWTLWLSGHAGWDCVQLCMGCWLGKT